MRDITEARKDFPGINRNINKHPLAFLDSGASSQLPNDVVNRVRKYQYYEHSNIHRGVHELSQRATEAYEEVRDTVTSFINASSRNEIIFTSGATEAINLVAQTLGKQRRGGHDKIIITHLEHHSNIVPWQMVCEETGAELLVVPINEKGEVNPNELYRMLDPSVKILALAHVSNTLGTILPLKQIIEQAHLTNTKVLVDGAQALPHIPVDVQDLDCDFYVFSGHKMLAPTGVGVLYGKEELLNEMPPYKGGGSMIEQVTFEKTTYAGLPLKFEAGTPNISGVVGLGAAIKYIESFGVDQISKYENDLLKYLIKELKKVKGIRLIGTASKKAGVQSFLLDDIHPHDIGTILDQQGVAVRAGHHCAQPVMEFFGVSGTVRASLALYNNKDDIDRLIKALDKVREVMG